MIKSIEEIPWIMFWISAAKFSWIAVVASSLTGVSSDSCNGSSISSTTSLPVEVGSIMASSGFLLSS